MPALPQATVNASRARSLRWRLLGATLCALLAATLLAGLFLAGLFREHVERQFAEALTQQLDQVTARIEFDPKGDPLLDEKALSDPRWSRPYSGYYWQVDEIAATGARPGVLRSRSLWDAEIKLAEKPQSGDAVSEEVRGPNGQELLVVSRVVFEETEKLRKWRVLVAGDMAQTRAAIQGFNYVVAAFLAILFVLLVAAAFAQVAIGLSPLRKLRDALSAVHAGSARRLEGEFPAEVQPLTQELNAVLERNAEIVERARTQAGNLAHAVRTPLAAMAQAAQAAQGDAAERERLPGVVGEQVAMATRQVEWHLARSRAAASHELPGARTAVAPVIAGVVRALERIHAARHLDFDATAVNEQLIFAGEEQDLQEIVGNLLDNACKWARSAVAIRSEGIEVEGRACLRITVEDDGPGIAPQARAAVLKRGVRLDETVQGSGLGLAIVGELAELYRGDCALDDAELGGLRVSVTLPVAR